MLQFAHASLLGIHLFEPLVLGELLSHLDLELLLHATLFGLSLCLELQLIILGGLQLLELSEAFRLSLTLGTSCAFFHLLNLKLVTQVLDVLGLGTSFSFLEGKFLEDGLTLSFSLILQSLQLSGTTLLLMCVPPNKLILILFELILALEERPLLVLREDHVLLGLLLLHLGDAQHLVVLVNHLVNDGVDLTALSEVLLLGLVSALLALLHLVLDDVFVLAQLLVLIGSFGVRLSVRHLLSTKHLDLDVGIFLQLFLRAELVFGHLSRPLLVQIGATDLLLQLLELIRLSAGLLDLTLFLLVDNLELLHLASKIPFHGHEVQ
jgi:hypothetical protein